jgi:hypothetical protein
MNLGILLIQGIIFTIFGYFIGVSLARTLFKIQKKVDRLVNIKNYYLHHDLCGLLLIIFSLILRPVWLGVALTGLGLGLFTHHMLTEGLKLVTRN